MAQPVWVPCNLIRAWATVWSDWILAEWVCIHKRTDYIGYVNLFVSKKYVCLFVSKYGLYTWTCLCVCLATRRDSAVSVFHSLVLRAASASSGEGFQSAGQALPGLYSLSMWCSWAGFRGMNSVLRELHDAWNTHTYVHSHATRISMYRHKDRDTRNMIAYFTKE